MTYLKMDIDDFQQEIINKVAYFNNKEPELKLIWHDPHSSAVGYLIINSFRNGAAAGGTRVNNNIQIEEIISLSKTMEIKLKFNLNVGGAKSGINYDPHSEDKMEVLKRWFKVISPLLREYYGTAGDLHVDVKEISNIFEDLNINNYLEGVVNAAFKNDVVKRKKAYYALNHSFNTEIALSKNLSKKLINLCTGFGIASGIKSYYQLKGNNIAGKRVYIQGTGFVGCATAYYLNQFGAKIVALSNIDCGAIYKNGIAQDDLIDIIAKEGNLKKFDDMLPLNKFNSDLKKVKFDIFIPAAASNMVSLEQIERYVTHNSLSMVACGANNPFIEKEYIYGECCQFIDKEIVLLPDFFINSGLAIAFSYMIDNCESSIKSERLFNYISEKMDFQLKRSLDRVNYDGSLVTAALLFDFFYHDIQVESKEERQEVLLD